MMGEGGGRGTAEGSSEPKLEGKGDVMRYDIPIANTQLPATKVYFCPCYGQKGASTRGFVFQLPLKHRIVSIGG